MPASARSARTLARRLFLSAVALAPLSLAPGAWGIEPTPRMAMRGMNAEAELPPIVSADQAVRPSSDKRAASAPKPSAVPSSAPAAHRPQATLGSRLARMQAAASEMLSGESGHEEARPTTSSGTLSPWMQEIDPAVRSQAAVAGGASPKNRSPVQPTRYQARLEDRGSTVVRIQADDSEARGTSEPTISELPAEKHAESSASDVAAARSGIGRPRTLMDGELGRMLGLKQVSGPSSRRTAAAQAPTQQPAPASQPQKQAPVVTPEEEQPAGPAAVVIEPAEPGDLEAVKSEQLSATDQAECQRLEEKLCELFPGREVQILIGRSHTTPTDHGECQIVAIIKGSQAGPRATEAKKSEAASVLKSRTAQGRFRMQ